MSEDFLKMMGGATALTREGRLADATRMIQTALRAHAGPGTQGGHPGGTPMLPAHRWPGTVTRTAAANPATRDAIPLAREGSGDTREVEGNFSFGTLTRRYLLAIPERTARPRSLIVMLHGCTQSAEDFARGTRMSEQAGARGFLVLYPAQSRDANPSGCWNWFREQDQQRAGGEAAFLAQLTRHIVAEHRIDPRRVFIAGLSAGGAMAATVADAYPEIFTAVGVHSGLAARAAGNLPDALAVMRNGKPRSRRARPARDAATVPTIVFHGEADQTVHPENSAAIIDQAIGGSVVTEISESGTSRSGKRFRKVVFAGSAAAPVAEQWMLDGVGHAWSGGDPSGTYTDAAGVDASNEMLRFFSEHMADAA